MSSKEALCGHYPNDQAFRKSRCVSGDSAICRYRRTVVECVTCLLLASVAALVLLNWRLDDSGLITQRRFQHVPTQAEVCQDYLGVAAPRDGMSLILTADPGTFSGTSEAHFIIANLQNKVTKPTSGSVCGGLYFGSLMGQHVLVVTTGIGPTAAALCVQELLTSCGSLVTEMIYFGTSGWSPQLGGVLNPPHCAHANSGRKISRLGDICISPVSINWVCKKSTWTLQSEGYPNQCFRPEEVAGPNATALYGECIFATDNLDANLALADSLLKAARSFRGRSATPIRNEAVVQQEQLYWQLMGEGTGQTYPEVHQEDKPVVWDYAQCAEVDGQFFFTGTPWEIKARDYAAQAIATALGLGKPGSGERNEVGAQDVIAVSAMEGVGVAEALEKYHRLDSTPRRIPYTNIRTASNWIHQPVGKVGEGQWDIYREVPEDYVNGYAYAIATGSVAILSLYQQRCLAREELARIGEQGGPDQQRLLAAQLNQHGMGGLALWARAGGAEERAGVVLGEGGVGGKEVATEAEGGDAGLGSGLRPGMEADGSVGPRRAAGGWARAKRPHCVFRVDYS